MPVVFLTASCLLTFTGRELCKGGMCRARAMLVPRCTMKLHLPVGRKPGHLHSGALANRKDSLKWEKGAFLTHQKPKLMYNMGGKGRKSE